MEAAKNSIHVNIYGEEYAIRSNGEAAYIREVAEYVDRKMRDAAEKVPNKSPSRIAILAALNITAELFSERKKGEQISAVEKRTHDIISLLDEKLSESAT